MPFIKKITCNIPRRLRMTVLLFFTLLFCQVTVTAASLIIKESFLPNQLGTYRHIRSNGIDLHAVILNDHYYANLYQQEAPHQSVAKTIQQLSLMQDFLIAVNGGYYTPQFQPAGLFIDQHKILRPLAKKDALLTACISVDENKKLFLGIQRENCLQAFSALQTGPVLIQDEDLSPYLRRPHSKGKEFLSAHRRTVIAQSTDQQVLVIVTSPIPLLRLAMLLKEQPALFGVKKITTAINLDGGPSTGMYIRFKRFPFYFPEQKSVKTFLFFR